MTNRETYVEIGRAQWAIFIVAMYVAIVPDLTPDRFWWHLLFLFISLGVGLLINRYVLVRHYYYRRLRP